MLTKLSPEVLHLVAQQLPGADLKSMSLVCVYIRRAVIRSLWSSITIRSPDRPNVHDISTEGFPDSYIPLASELHFAAYSISLRHDRCAHLEGHSSWTQQRDATELSYLDRTGQRASSFMAKFESGRIRSFSWDLRCCVPEAILGENGLLPRMHPSLESLRLITNSPEPEEFVDHGRIDLSPFRNLKSICWKEPTNGNHHLQLDTVIKNNAHHLGHLELDFYFWYKHRPLGSYSLNNDENDSGYFGNIFKLHEHTTQPIFQSLTSLVLTHAPLGPAMVDMINFEVLRSLTLRQCTHWDKFAERIMKMGFPVKLKTFELQSHSGDHTQSKLEDFIAVCGGLEELFLNILEPVDARSLWKHIAYHKASLKRLMMHYREPQEWDVPNLGLTKHGDRLYYPPLTNPLSELKLECISMCWFAELAGLMLKTSSSLPSLKLIHIRKTGCGSVPFVGMPTNSGPHPKVPPLIISLAEWAFGPEGAPLLEALVYGDFAQEDWAYVGSLILCPAPDGFRMVPKHGYEWTGIVDKYRNVLEACPIQSMF